MTTLPALSSVNNILDTDLVLVEHSNGEGFKMTGTDLKALMKAQAVDTVAANNMNSVTSNAVAQALISRPSIKYINVDETTDSAGNIFLGKDYRDIIPIAFIPSNVGENLWYWQFASYYNYVYLRMNVNNTRVTGILYYYDR